MWLRWNSKLSIPFLPYFLSLFPLDVKLLLCTTASKCTNASVSFVVNKLHVLGQVWDATAADPRLLVFLKGYRNTVPVPRHWCQKRKFLQVHHIAPETYKSG